jgi:hypothetical protein
MKNEAIFVGKKHGHLTVIREVARDNRSIRRYECQCDCGNKAILRSNHFYQERKYCTRSCPLLAEHRMLNLLGKTINRWTVISYAKEENNRSLWNAKCICGTERVISGSSLLAGQTKSCGCFLNEARATGRSPQEELEVRRTRSRLSNRRNPARVKANKIKYESKRKSATPKWVNADDMKAMNDIYDKARNITRATGIKHQVDHVIPINGKNVSGLHVPQNLQILTQAENVSKSNIYAELLGD